MTSYTGWDAVKILLVIFVGTFLLIWYNFREIDKVEETRMTHSAVSSKFTEKDFYNYSHFPVKKYSSSPYVIGKAIIIEEKEDNVKGARIYSLIGDMIKLGFPIANNSKEVSTIIHLKYSDKLLGNYKSISGKTVGRATAETCQINVIDVLKSEQVGDITLEASDYAPMSQAAVGSTDHHNRLSKSKIQEYIQSLPRKAQ